MVCGPLMSTIYWGQAWSWSLCSIHSFVCMCRCCVRTLPKQTSTLWSRTFFISTTWRPSVSEGRAYKTHIRREEELCGRCVCVYFCLCLCGMNACVRVCVRGEHFVLPQLACELWQRHTCTTDYCHPGETFLGFWCLMAQACRILMCSGIYHQHQVSQKHPTPPEISSHSTHNSCYK